MKAENLLVLASARGLRLELARPKRDIPYAHKQPPRRRDVVKATEDRPGSPGIPGVLSADGKQGRSARAAEWGAEALGHAAAGMADRPWRTLCWAIGLEDQARMYLKGELLMIACEAKERDRWPDKVRRGRCTNQLREGVRCGMLRCTDGKYLEDLCELALIEVAEPYLFGADAARARQFGVADHVWARTITNPYHYLLQQVQGWYRAAIGHINARLVELNEEAHA